MGQYTGKYASCEPEYEWLHWCSYYYRKLIIPLKCGMFISILILPKVEDFVGQLVHSHG